MTTALVTGSPLSESYAQELTSLGFDVVNGSASALGRLGVPLDDRARELTEEEIAELITSCSVYVYGGLEPASAMVLERAANLRLIAFLGTGWADPGCVDAEAAAKRGLLVSNTPHANAASVAELAMGLVVALSRDLVAMNSATKQGGWQPIRTNDVAGRRLGIIGLGQIGRRLARHAVAGFSMKVAYFGPHRKPDLERELGVEYQDLRTLVSNSDVVSIHAPADTALGLIDRDMLRQMKPRSILLNLSAPEIVDGVALADALEDGRLRSAGLDGLYQESELRKRLLALGDDKLVVTPRAAWLTEDSYARMAAMALASIRDLVSGTRPVAYQVSPSLSALHSQSHG